MNKKAFTLIELLVVIAIIGILSGAIAVSMNSAIGAARDGMRKADISVLRTALLEYSILNNNTYPIADCSVNESCTALYEALVPAYIGSLPTDPLGTYYTYESDGSTFVTTATLSDATTYSYDSTVGFSTGSGGSSYVSTCLEDMGGGIACAESTDGSYTIYTFTRTSTPGTTTWTVPSGVTSVEYLVVGGGGAGSGNQLDLPYSGYGNSAGGGGGGGVLTNFGQTKISVSSSVDVVVGAGGIASLTKAKSGNGGNSSFGLIVATGGGAGGKELDSSGNSGGSGGGASYGGIAGSGNTPTTTPSQGNNGGGSGQSTSGGGGGGGAGTVGSSDVGVYPNNNGGNGGNGISCAISGTSVFYGGGGGGGCHYLSISGGSGGLGGGGNGGLGIVGVTAGANNSGGGGGGAGTQSVYNNAAYNFPGGNGGSGIVIIRFTIL